MVLRFGCGKSWRRQVDTLLQHPFNPPSLYLCNELDIEYSVSVNKRYQLENATRAAVVCSHFHATENEQHSFLTESNAFMTIFIVKKGVNTGMAWMWMVRRHKGHGRDQGCLYESWSTRESLRDTLASFVQIQGRMVTKINLGFQW